MMQLKSTDTGMLSSMYHNASTHSNTAKPVMLHPADLRRAGPLLETRIRASSNCRVPFAIYQPPATSIPVPPTRTTIQTAEQEPRLGKPKTSDADGQGPSLGKTEFVVSADRSAGIVDASRSGSNCMGGDRRPSACVRLSSSAQPPIGPPVCARGRPPKRSNTHFQTAVGRTVPRGPGPTHTVGPARLDERGIAIDSVAPTLSARQTVPSAVATRPLGQTALSAVPTRSVEQIAQPAVPTRPMGQTDLPAVPTRLVGQIAPPAVPTRPVGQTALSAVPTRSVGQIAPPAVPTRPVGQTAPPAVPTRPLGQTAPPAVPTRPVRQTALPAVPTRSVGQIVDTLDPIQIQPVAPNTPAVNTERAVGEVNTDAGTAEIQQDSPVLPITPKHDGNDDWADEKSDNLWPFPFSEYPSDSWLEEDKHRAMFCDLLDADDPFFYDSDCLYSDLYPGGLHLDIPSWENYLYETHNADNDVCYYFTSETVDDITISPVPVKETLYWLPKPTQTTTSTHREVYNTESVAEVKPATKQAVTEVKPATKQNNILNVSVGQEGIAEVGNPALRTAPNKDYTRPSDTMHIFNGNCTDIVHVTDADRQEIDKRLGYLIDSISESQSSSCGVDTLDITCNSDVTESVHFINGLSASIQSLMNAATSFENVANPITKDQEIVNLHTEASASSKSPNESRGNENTLMLQEQSPKTSAIKYNSELISEESPIHVNTEHVKYITNTGNETHKPHLNVGDYNAGIKNCSVTSKHDRSETQSNINIKCKPKDTGHTVSKTQDTKKNENKPCINVLSQIKDMPEEKRAYIFKKLKDTMEKLKIKIESQTKTNTTVHEKYKYHTYEKKAERKETKQHIIKDENSIEEQKEMARQELARTTIPANNEVPVSPGVEDTAVTNSTPKLCSNTFTNSKDNEKVKMNATYDHTMKADKIENKNTNTYMVQASEIVADTVERLETKQLTMETSSAKKSENKTDNKMSIELMMDMKKAVENISMDTTAKPNINQTQLNGGGDFIKKQKPDNLINVKIKVENEAVVNTCHSDNSQETELTQIQPIPKCQESVRNTGDGSGDCIEAKNGSTNNTRNNSKDTQPGKNRRVTRSRKTTEMVSTENGETANTCKKPNGTEAGNTGISSPCKRQISATNLVEGNSSRRRLV